MSEYNWVEDSKKSWELALAWKRFLLAKGIKPATAYDLPTETLTAYLKEFLDNECEPPTKV